MAIVEWKEAAAAATLTAGKRGSHEWSAPYILKSDNPRDDALTCIEFMEDQRRGIYSVFKYGDTVDTSAVCNSISPVRMQGSVEYWLVTLSYGPPVPIVDEPPQGAVDEQGNPTDDPTAVRMDVSIGVSHLQVPVYKAWNVDEMPSTAVVGSGGYVRPANTLGPVHNSAGIVYDPPLMRYVTELVLRVTRNLVQCDVAPLLTGVNHINATPLQFSPTMIASYDMKPCHFPAYSILMSDASGEYHGSYGSGSYWRMTHEFRLRTAADSINPQDGFLETILDRGFSRLSGAGDPDGRGITYTSGDIKAGGGIHAAIRDPEGERTPEAVMLNGHGQPLQSSSTWTQPPVYFRWRVHPTCYFPALPIPVFVAG